MPLGKYHCDYCDKQFQDTPGARKRHLQGLSHQRARALWYDSFKEPHGVSPLFQPDGSLAKGVCHHFVRSGVCKYGDACKYFHPKQDSLNPARYVTELSYHPDMLPFQNSSVTNFQLRENLSGTSTIMNQAGISWGNLPPSLRPPPPDGGQPLPFVDWG
ncbi:zinc finger CCCH domain-containing protein 3-like [Zingiber officinale]|uniref:zinc finger CCCH domain-containing protein 3-like n=1 Tax=Zingiber officinale TaxID=94328 RepID=UPI001C4C1AB2|nr:zinc finger CCCH domain-containing protein 3-like [Zingiber officinale]